MGFAGDELASQTDIEARSLVVRETIVGLLVTNIGSDMGSVTPTLEDIKAAYGALPAKRPADANHEKHSCIEAATRAAVAPLIATPKGEQCATTPVSLEIEAWRKRMNTDEGKRACRARPAIGDPRFAPRCS